MILYSHRREAVESDATGRIFPAGVKEECLDYGFVIRGIRLGARARDEAVAELGLFHPKLLAFWRRGCERRFRGREWVFLCVSWGAGSTV